MNILKKQFVLKSVACLFIVIYIFSVIPLTASASSNNIKYIEKAIARAKYENGNINIYLTETEKANTVVIDVTSGVLKGLTGSQGIFPGALQTANFNIINQTGETFTITEFNIESQILNPRRIYNDAAVNTYGNLSTSTKNTVEALTSEQWYQLNADYFGEQNFTDLNILRKMFGQGDISQGTTLSKIDNGEKMLSLASFYLFQNCIQLSFDTQQYPVNSNSNKNVFMQDYLSKTPENQEIISDVFFSKTVDENTLSFPIGYRVDGARTGNTFNGALSDFGFSLTLKRDTSNDPVEYTVRYLNETTNKEILSSKTGVSTLGSIIISNDEIISIEGYSFKDANITSLTISQNSEDNVLILYYSQDINSEKPESSSSASSTSSTPSTPIDFEYVNSGIFESSSTEQNNAQSHQQQVSKPAINPSTGAIITIISVLGILGLLAISIALSYILIFKRKEKN